MYMISYPSVFFCLQLLWYVGPLLLRYFRLDCVMCFGTSSSLPLCLHPPVVWSCYRSENPIRILKARCRQVLSLVVKLRIFAQLTHALFPSLPPWNPIVMHAAQHSVVRMTCLITCFRYHTCA